MNVLSLDPSLVCSSTTGASETVLAGVDAAAGEFDDDMAFRSSARLAAFSSTMRAMCSTQRLSVGGSVSTTREGKF